MMNHDNSSRSIKTHHDESSLCNIMMHNDGTSWRIIMIRHDESSLCITTMHDDDDDDSS